MSSSIRPSSSSIRPDGLLGSGRPDDREWTRPLSPVQKREAQLFALEVIRDPEYRANLKKAAIARTLAPAVEIRLLEYAYGKPPEKIELGRPGAFSRLDDLGPEGLAERASLLVLALRGSEEAAAELAADATAEAQADLDELVSAKAKKAEAQTFSLPSVKGAHALPDGWLSVLTAEDADPAEDAEQVG